MNIFILEDSIERIKMFRKKLSKHSVTYCDDVETSKEILQKNKFDIIFFDHDLDHRVFVSSSEPNTGYQLAKWIANETDLVFEKVIVHSMNPVGAEHIKKEALKFSDNVQKIIFPILIQQLNI